MHRTDSRAEGGQCCHLVILILHHLYDGEPGLQGGVCQGAALLPWPCPSLAAQQPYIVRRMLVQALDHVLLSGHQE